VIIRPIKTACEDRVMSGTEKRARHPFDRLTTGAEGDGMSAPGHEEHPRVIGWVGATAMAIGGSNQSLFIIGALLLAQGTAAVPLLIAGLLLAWLALPGWIELVCMWPNRVGGIAATCAEAFRPYSPVLANLTGVSYWWGWVPTCGLTAILSADAVHSWYLPMVPVHLLAVVIVVGFTLLNLRGIKVATRTASAIGAVAASLAFASVVIPVLTGHTNWHRAANWHLQTPFHGVFGAVTSAMAGLYLIGFAAPAFEAAACHVGEMRGPARNVPRAMFAAAGLATVFFLFIPLVWLGVLGAHPIEGNLVNGLGPTFAPLFGATAKSVALWFIVSNMLHGTLQPLAGASRTLSQLADDGLLPRSLSRRNRHDAPVIATLLTATMSIAFLLSDDPPSVIAAANFTYLIGICMPSVAVWLLRRNHPEMQRPWRAPRGTVVAGVVAVGVWALSTLFGFQQFGLSYVLIGLALAYSGSMAYAWRRWRDRRATGVRGFTGLSLHAKLSGAMITVMVLDGAGYLLAVHNVGGSRPALVTGLQDIFVTVALLTVTVGLILPGIISHSVTQVGEAARRVVQGPLAELTAAMVALGEGDLDGPALDLQIQAVSVRGRDEVSAMAEQFNAMQSSVTTAAAALDRTRVQLRDSQQQLRFVADHDPLTGLFNRRRFEHELRSALTSGGRRHESHALILVDLDNFKLVNDTRGHAVGDEVLNRVANVMRQRLRTTDILARLGGDEFAVILPDLTIEKAAVVADALIREVSDQTVVIDPAGRAVRIQASGGVVAFDNQSGHTIGSLLVDADIAMYDAKAAGRNRVAIAAYEPEQRARLAGRQGCVEAIRAALDGDGFELWSQPILNLATNALEREELLLRMRRDGELIPPGVFLPVAEQVGLITDIDIWVIRDSFRLVRERIAAGESPRVHINLSGASITEAKVIEVIKDGISAGVPAGALVFEITETAAIADIEQARQFAGQLRDAGCGLALDDFGSGFGSFYYLKHLPFDCLKIDGDFINGLSASEPDQHVVRAIIQIANGMGMTTIAEFVEDDETLDMVRQMGADMAQGFGIARPAPTDFTWIDPAEIPVESWPARLTPST
jgi:diguanylate cyclase (GGDEF)-like protein